MAKNDFAFKKGDEVYDSVHEMEGIIVDVVPEPEDGHHATFFVVELKDGRKVNLVKEQIG